ncbi:MAG: hypothetical protein Q9N02_00415 [Ghiorsea sp.]|nr:hypothetical protein [Ghiorsea sp.]
MNKKIIMVVLLGVLSFGSTIASANIGAFNAFNAHFHTPSSCTTCHSGTPGVVSPLGNVWKANGGTSQAGLSSQANWTTFDTKYKTTYGGVNPSWVFSAPTPVGTASVTGCVSRSLSTPLMMVLGLLSLGFFVRRKKIGEEVNI